jgi:hypothetical protein
MKKSHESLTTGRLTTFNTPPLSHQLETETLLYTTGSPLLSRVFQLATGQSVPKVLFRLSLLRSLLVPQLTYLLDTLLNAPNNSQLSL